MMRLTHPAPGSRPLHLTVGCYFPHIALHLPHPYVGDAHGSGERSPSRVGRREAEAVEQPPSRPAIPPPRVPAIPSRNASPHACHCSSLRRPEAVNVGAFSSGTDRCPHRTLRVPGHGTRAIRDGARPGIGRRDHADRRAGLHRADLAIGHPGADCVLRRAVGWIGLAVSESDCAGATFHGAAPED